MLGSYGSGVSIAAAPTFQSASIPAIGCSCTNPAVTEANPYYFRVCFLDPFQGSVMANFAKDEFSAANAYVLSMLGEDYGSGLATYFVNAFEDLGGTVTSEQFPEGTSDFSAYIQNAINAGADVIFAPCATTYAAQIITQAASAGFDKPITAGDTWESSVILDAQKGTSVQVYCSTFFDENDDSGAAKEFVTGFKEWLNADSQKLTNNGGNDIVAAVSALGYDGYMVALEAIKAAGSTDGTAIRDALYGVNYDGVTGNITFDQTTGDANKDMAYIKKAADGAFEFVKTQSVEGGFEPVNSFSQRLTALPAPSTREPFCSLPAGLAPSGRGLSPEVTGGVYFIKSCKKWRVPLMAAKFLPYLLAGISVGGQYALIAIGYTMVYGILRLINFAHGDIFTVAGFLMVYATASLPLTISIPLVVVATVLLGIAVEKIAYKPLRTAPRMSVMISAIGMSYLLQNSMWYVTGGLAKQYPALPWISDTVTVLGCQTKRVTVVTPFLVIVLVAALVTLIQKTKIGMAMRAASRDFETAQLMGIKINNVISFTFAVGSFLAAIGSMMYFSNYTAVTPTVGAMPGLKAFVAAVFGGIGSIPGAVIGGFIIGICESLIKGAGATTFSDAFTFALLIVVLAVKPTGLFSENLTEKV